MFPFDLGDVLVIDRQAMFPQHPRPDLRIGGGPAERDAPGIGPRFIVQVDIPASVLLAFAYSMSPYYAIRALLCGSSDKKRR